jgi:hypothetical protein
MTQVCHEVHYLLLSVAYYDLYQWYPFTSCSYSIVELKSSIPWDMMACSLANVTQHFGETYCLHLQDQRVSQAKSQDEAGSKQSSVCFMLVHCLTYSLTLKMQAVCSSKTLIDFQLIELLCNKSEYSLHT